MRLILLTAGPEQHFIVGELTWWDKRNEQKPFNRWAGGKSEGAREEINDGWIEGSRGGGR